MCTSTKPGMAEDSLARTSSAPAGNSIAALGPIISISPSRITIPASAISPLGVRAVPTCKRVVAIATRYRRRIPHACKTKRASAKTKWAEPLPRPYDPFFARILHALFRSHFDGAQFDGVALYVAFYRYMMPGMRGDLVLRINRVYFLVGVVHEYILGALFLDALGGAFASLGVCSLGSAVAVRNPAGQTGVCSEAHGRCKQRCRRDGCDSKFHKHSSKTTVALDSAQGHGVS